MNTIVLGVDLGQRADYTAIAAIEFDPPLDRPKPGYEHIPQVAPTIRLSHLERIKLHTTYPEIVRHCGRLMQMPQLRGKTDLVVDETGVGVGVVDVFRENGMDPISVMITSGTQITHDKDSWKVPKRDLVVALQVAMQRKRFLYSKKLPMVEPFRREVLAFKVKIDELTAHDSYAAREGEHDDLVLAVALAAWRAEWVLKNRPVGFTQQMKQFKAPARRF